MPPGHIKESCRRESVFYDAYRDRLTVILLCLASLRSPRYGAAPTQPVSYHGLQPFDWVPGKSRLGEGGPHMPSYAYYLVHRYVMRFLRRSDPPHGTDR
jgi:hypothetical protein